MYVVFLKLGFIALVQNEMRTVVIVCNNKEITWSYQQENILKKIKKIQQDSFFFFFYKTILTQKLQ